jgi:hypothetical protein
LYFLAEAEFALDDTENEKRYGYKLADALARAKTSGRKLFEGKAFYVTPKVPVDAKLLKAVVTAGGGQVRFYDIRGLPAPLMMQIATHSDTDGTHFEGTRQSLCHFVPTRRLDMEAALRKRTHNLHAGIDLVWSAEAAHRLGREDAQGSRLILTGCVSGGLDLEPWIYHVARLY